MLTRLMLFVLAATLIAFGQGRGGGRPAGAGAGAGGTGGGRPDFAGQPSSPGKPADAPRGAKAGAAGKPHHQGHAGKRTLSESQRNSGAFRMLQDKTGMSAEQLQAAYAGSGAKNFGQFTSAMVVSRNLGLDQNQVLAGLQTKSLGETLQSMGVEPGKAKQGIRDAEREAEQANRAHGKKKSKS